MNAIELVESALQMLKAGLLSLADYLAFLGEIGRSKTPNEQAAAAKKFRIK